MTLLRSSLAAMRLPGAAEARPVATLGSIADAEQKDVLAQLRDWSGLEPARGGESMTAVV